MTLWLLLLLLCVPTGNVVQRVAVTLAPFDKYEQLSTYKAVERQRPNISNEAIEVTQGHCGVMSQLLQECESIFKQCSVLFSAHNTGNQLTGMCFSLNFYNNVKSQSITGRTQQLRLL